MLALARSPRMARTKPRVSSSCGGSHRARAVEWVASRPRTASLYTVREKMLGNGTPHIEEDPGKQIRTSRGVWCLPRSLGTPGPLGNTSTIGDGDAGWECGVTLCERVSVLAGVSAVAPMHRRSLEAGMGIDSSCSTRTYGGDWMKRMEAERAGIRRDDEGHRRSPRKVEQ